MPRRTALVTAVSVGAGMALSAGPTFAGDDRHQEHDGRLPRLGVRYPDQADVPPSGVLRIPHVARLDRAVVTRTGNGISVIGLRSTLVDGSGRVVNLAEANLRIHMLP